MMLPAINVEDFERKYVNDIYEKLARSFVTSSTNSANGLRHKRWDKVDEFLQSFPPGSVIADLGETLFFVKRFHPRERICLCFTIESISLKTSQGGGKRPNILFLFSL